MNMDIYISAKVSYNQLHIKKTQPSTLTPFMKSSQPSTQTPFTKSSQPSALALMLQSTVTLCCRVILTTSASSNVALLCHLIGFSINKRKGNFHATRPVGHGLGHIFYRLICTRWVILSILQCRLHFVRPHFTMSDCLHFARIPSLSPTASLCTVAFYYA